MNIDNSKEDLYVLIDWKRTPATGEPLRECILTRNEAIDKNYAYAVNGTSLRFVRSDNYWDVSSTTNIDSSGQPALRDRINHFTNLKTDK